jgi:hypothetical protein
VENQRLYYCVTLDGYLKSQTHTHIYENRSLKKLISEKSLREKHWAKKT